MKTYSSLIELVKSESASIKTGGKRPYKVKHGEDVVFALANSAGKAALTVCAVETCPPKDVQAAALEALCESVDISS